MSKAIARRERILGLLAGQERGSMDEMASQLGVSTMTVRRDIEALASEGLVLRTPGGCVLRSALVAEATFSEKEGLRREAKAAIALRAVAHLTRGMRIYLDTGTTCLHVARALPLQMDLQVYTNNLRIVSELAGRTGVCVTVYGGALAGRNPDLIGEYAVARIASLHLDLAFTGADALDPETGQFYAADPSTALLTETAQRQSGKTIALIDSSKCGRRGVAVAGRLGPGSILITDSELPGNARRMLRRTGAILELSSLTSGGAGRAAEKPNKGDKHGGANGSRTAHCN